MVTQQVLAYPFVAPSEVPCSKVLASQFGSIDITLDCCATQDRHNMLVCWTRFFFFRTFMDPFFWRVLFRREAQKRTVFYFHVIRTLSFFFGENVMFMK